MKQITLLKNKKVFLSLILLFAINVIASAQSIYTLDLATQAIGSGNGYAAKTGTVDGITWYVNVGSCQTTTTMWLGTNNATNYGTLTKLDTGLNGRGSAIADALGVVDVSTVGYYAMVGMNDISDVKSVTVQAPTTGGTAPASMWCLYSTDNGTTYTILDGVKTSPGTSLVTFTAASVITKAQYAFVWYSSTAGTYRTPRFDFYGDQIVYTITPALNNPAGGTANLFGSVITATPSACYTYDSPAYTVSPVGAADVSQSGNNFTVSNLTDNVTVTINFVELPIYTVTFKCEDETFGSPLQTECGKITLPAGPTLVCSDWDFIGWAKTSVDETTTKPTVYGANTTYVPDGNEIMYAVYSKLTSGTVSNYTPDETAQQFVIAAKVVDTYNALATFVSSSTSTTRYSSVITTNISNGVILVTTADATGYDWTIQDNGIDGFTISTGTNFLKGVNGATNIYCNANEEYWTIGTGTKGSYRITSAFSRSLGLNTTGANNIMGHYLASNFNNAGYYDIELLPINDVTFLYSSITDCKLTSINPTFESQLFGYSANNNIYLNNLSASSTVYVYNVAGQLLIAQKTGTSTVTLPVAQKGIYIVKVVSAANTSTIKVLNK
ncbi:MAG: T9SS type A sorting domain-containing protein [Candidatus Azobacteroides sp.]|nr:T9SS type A sorting domain-containing protein [Candidatus Azobacteroides sp.]